MIKNYGALLVAVLLAGCRTEERYPGAFSGVVEHEQRDLAFEVPGRLDKVLVSRGARVDRGGVLATLDDTLERTQREASAEEAQAAAAQVALLRAGSRPEEISAARAQIRATRAQEELFAKNLEREQQLLSRGASTQTAVDELESRLRSTRAEREALEHNLRALQKGARREEVETAEARAEAASTGVDVQKERLRRYQLLAPLSGTVLDVLIEPGEVVGAGAAVVTLADTKQPYIDVFVPQAEVAGIRVGVKATAFVDAYSQSFPGKVEHIWPRAEFTPRFLFSERERPNLVIRVRVRIEDPGEKLLAGLPAFVRIEHAGAAK